MNKRMGDISLISWDSDPLTSDELIIVERSIGRLPDDYREFLLTCNGGRTVGEVRIPHIDANHSFHYVTGLSVVEPDFPPLVLAPRIGWSWRRFIPIAKCYESPFLMNLTSGSAGTIHYWPYDPDERWDAEEAGRPYLPTKQSLELVANSFSEFQSRLVSIPHERVPSRTEFRPTVENYAKNGDHFFAEASAFFSKMSLNDLNAKWPKLEEHAFQPIHYAANWVQPRTAKLLIERGVDIHRAVRVCTNSFEIAQMMVSAGATLDDLQALLLSAAAGMGATSSAEENHKIIMQLLAQGVRPDFGDPVVLADWTKYMDQIYTKKILRFLLEVLDFPDSISEPIKGKLARRSA